MKVIKPDFEHIGYRQVTFTDQYFRNAMVRLLNWLEQPNEKVIRAKSGDYHNTNGFYALHGTIQVEYDNEFGDYHISIFVGDMRDD